MASTERNQGSAFFLVNGLNSQFSSQYGVELDLPAATILSVFGLRAQARSATPLQICFDANVFAAVLLVAEHIVVGHLLCYIYGCQLRYVTFLRQRTTVVSIRLP